MLGQGQQQNLKELHLQESTQNQADYHPTTRVPQVSLKYSFTLMNKQIHLLKSDQPSDSIHNMPIVCSYADMEFKLSPQIRQDWARRISQPDLHLGYMFLPTARQAIVQRIKQNVGVEFRKEEIVLINSMLTFYYLAVTQLTQINDQVLIFTPTYYRFVYTLQTEKRRIVEYELRTTEDENGDTEFWIDFQELEKTFAQNQIKLMVFANPHNPAGKIWSKQDIIQIKNLCIKYDCLIFSDDIFSDCIPNPRQKYTSLLEFPEIYHNLVWAGSFGKAFNCSGNSFTYGVIQNPQIRQKISQNIMNMNLYPTFAAGQLMESCYAIGDQWRLRTIDYINKNYALLKQEIKRRGIKINMYKLECAFIPLLDFASYKWPHSEIKKRLESQNIFPTFLETCYIKRQKQSISCVRFNIAMNKEVLIELIDRLQKAVQN